MRGLGAGGDGPLLAFLQETGRSIVRMIGVNRYLVFAGLGCREHNPAAAASLPLMPAAVDSAFTVAFWFCRKALAESEFLQPQKLQRLLFLAQAIYAVLHGGGKLMPAVFVADELGPTEPNIHVALANDRRPFDDCGSVPAPVESVLEQVWGRYGHLSVALLTRMTTQTPAFIEAARRGSRAEIALEAMQRSLSSNWGPVSASLEPGERLMRTQSGRTVPVRAWHPAMKPAVDPASSPS